MDSISIVQIYFYKQDLINHNDVTFKSNLATTNALAGYNSKNGTQHTMETLAKHIKDNRLDDSSKNIPYFAKEDKFTETMIRKNSSDITISIDNKIKKIIKDVYYRSVGLELNPDGDPIYETIQFIAKDLEEY